MIKIKKLKKEKIVNIIIFVSTCISVIFLPNTVNSLPIIGIMIIFISTFMLYRYRKSTRICLLIGIMMIISISFATSVCFNTYETAFNWQVKLIETESNIINAKNYLLFIAIISIAIGNVKNEEQYNIVINKSISIVVVGSLALIFILVFCFNRGGIGEEYKSNSNPLYEYAIIVFLIVWMYSKNMQKTKIFLIIYAVLYCLQGLIFGDRSSAFPMILMLFILLNKRKYNIKGVILIGLIGIFLANVFDIFRNTGIINFETIKEVFSRGLFVNTISYSFYAGTQIINYRIIATDKIFHMLKYILAIFVGRTSQLDLASLATQAGFGNKGGGLTYAYYYYWGGYLGTIIFSLIMGRIINKIFNQDSVATNMLKVTITIFCIRWFVYYPIAFYRTAIAIPLICYALCEIYQKVIKKLLACKKEQRTNSEKEIENEE